MSKKVILMTRPRYDLPTSYLFYFAEGIVDEIKKINEYTLIDLKEKNASYENFKQAIIKTSPRLVILNGHGAKGFVCGQKGEILLMEENVSFLKDTITYAIACDSASDLGDLAISKGKADSFIGYESKFMVAIDETKTATLTKDKNALPFKLVYVYLLLRIFAGLSVIESVQRTKSFIRDLIREYGVYGSRDTYGDAPLIRFALFWNLLNLKMYGNGEATL